MTKAHKIITVATVGVLAILANAFLPMAVSSQSKGSSGFDSAVDQNGNIRVPDVDFRKDWVSLGAWAVANDEDGKQGSKGMHVVYTQPETVAAYRKTGKFPDGAVLVKELFSSVTEAMTTGTISRADKTAGYFVMVKDSTGRFPNNKLWGDGWGWSFFGATETRKTTSTDYKADCLGCHIPAKKNDWIYTQGYPVLGSR